MDMWIEIQVEMEINSLDHVLYEIDRLEPSGRFMEAMMADGLEERSIVCQHEGEFRFSNRLR